MLQFIFTQVILFVLKTSVCIHAKNISTTIDFSWVEKAYASDLKEELSNPLAKDLKLIGLYLAEHKYFEVDRRYTFTPTQYDKAVFYKHFPRPRIRRRSESVVSACDKGFIPCVNEIVGKAKRAGTLGKIHKKHKRVASYHPFKDAQEMFRYRATASYYMCWYTEMREQLLALPVKVDCFKDLDKTMYAKDKTIHDFRSSVKFEYGGTVEYSMFTCSYLWFCPDPCYGKSSKGNVKSKDNAISDPENPCKNLQYKDCYWSVGKNKNFEDLIRNKFNFSCACEDERKGFVWSPMYLICVDRDECYEGLFSCQKDKICLNVVGSYTCTCRRGFYEDTSSSKCVRHVLLSAAASSALQKKKDAKENGETSFIIQLLYDIAKGHCSTLSLSKFLYVICFLLYILMDYGYKM